jgi:hypothetical protein
MMLDWRDDRRRVDPRVNQTAESDAGSTNNHCERGLMTGRNFDGLAVEVDPEDTIAEMARETIAAMSTRQARAWIVRLLAGCGMKQGQVADVMRCSPLTVRRDSKGPTTTLDEFQRPGARP